MIYDTLLSLREFLPKLNEIASKESDVVKFTSLALEDPDLSPCRSIVESLLTTSGRHADKKAKERIIEAVDLYKCKTLLQHAQPHLYKRLLSLLDLSDNRYTFTFEA
jgi:hypothetical protein